MRYKAQQLDIPLVKGLTGNIESRMQQPGGMAVAKNIILEKPGRIAKRPALKYDGTLLQHDNTSMTGTVHRLADRDGKQVRLDTSGAFEYLAPLDRYKSLGAFPEAGYPERQVVSRAADRSHSWSAGVVVNSYRVHVWVEETTSQLYVGDLWASVHDSNGALLFRERLATTTAARPRLFALSTTHAVVLWHEGAGPNYDVKGRTLTLNGGIPVAWNAAVTLWTATLSSEYQWDACGDANAIFAAIFDKGAPDTIKVLRFDSSLTSTHGQTLNVTADQTLGIFSDATNLWIGWGDATGTPTLYYSVLACDDLSSTLAPTVMASTAGFTFESIVFGSVDSTTAFFAYTDSRVLSPYGFACRSTVVGTCTTAGAGAVGDRTPWAQIASRVVKWSNKFYFVCNQQSLAQSFEYAHYLVEGVATGALLRPVAVFAKAGLVPLDTVVAYRQRNEITAVDSNTFYWAGREAYTFEDGIIGTAGTTAWTWDMLDDEGQIPVSFGGTTWLSGGLVSVLDGTHVAEAGFCYSPQVTHIAKTAGAASYTYAFSYIWLDNEGKLHESALGPVSYNAGQWQVGTTVTSATAPLTLTVQTLGLTNKVRGSGGASAIGNPLAVRAYRTTDGGPVLQFLGDYTMDRTAFSVAITDNTSDATLATRPAAYTEGALPFGQCVAARHLAVFDNRIAAAVDTGVKFTTQATEDRAPQFIDNDTHTIGTRDGSACKALAVLDDVLEIFKDGRIYLSQGGNGPGPNGAPVYPEARLLAADTGCTNPLSVVSTPAGTFFEGARGLYLVPRGFGNVTWAGDKAREILASTPYIIGSALHPERGLAIWSVADAARDSATTGALLVFDYHFGEWMTWGIDYTNDAFQSVGRVFRGIATVGSSLWLGISGASYVDDGVITHATSGEGYITSTLTTEKIHPAGLITGYARASAVRILGEYRAACTLKIEANINETGWSYSKSWALPEASEAAGARILKEWALPVQKCDTLQLRITDLVNGESGATAGPVIHSLTLDVAAKPAGRPLHSAARG